MAAALVVPMVDCCNRHGTDTLAACYVPDTWSTRRLAAGGRRFA